MNKDDEDEYPTSSEDAFYEADYDEDTIDYDLDAEEFLEDEEFEPEPTARRDTREEDSEFPAGQEDELDQESEYDFEPESESEPEEVWFDDNTEDNDQEYTEPWPLGLIAAAVVALLLLAAGGYGIIQQRAEMQEEIRQLRAALATTASNEEVSASRQAQRALGVHNEQLQSQLDKLQRENQELRATVSKLKTAPAPEPKPAVPAPRAKEKPVAKQPVAIIPKATAAPAGAGWFVNFGSYKVEETANKWASRLQVDEGRLVVVSGNKGNTRYYRVRIIDLPNRAIAEKIAHQLEQTHKLSGLWIGKQ